MTFKYSELIYDSALGIAEIKRESNCCVCGKPTRSHHEEGKFYCHVCYMARGKNMSEELVKKINELVAQGKSEELIAMFDQVMAQAPKAAQPPAPPAPDMEKLAGMAKEFLGGDLGDIAELMDQLKTQIALANESIIRVRNIEAMNLEICKKLAIPVQ